MAPVSRRPNSGGIILRTTFNTPSDSPPISSNQHNNRVSISVNSRPAPRFNFFETQASNIPRNAVQPVLLRSENTSRTLPRGRAQGTQNQGKKPGICGGSAVPRDSPEIMLCQPATVVPQTTGKKNKEQKSCKYSTWSVSSPSLREVAASKKQKKRRTKAATRQHALRRRTCGQPAGGTRSPCCMQSLGCC